MTHKITRLGCTRLIWEYACSARFDENDVVMSGVEDGFEQIQHFRVAVDDHHLLSGGLLEAPSDSGSRTAAGEMVAALVIIVAPTPRDV